MAHDFKGCWINLVKEYVTTISYSIIGGQPFGFFKPNSGLLRQGDLYPHIFSCYVQKVYLSCFTK